MEATHSRHNSSNIERHDCFLFILSMYLFIRNEGVCTVDGGTQTRTRSLIQPASCGGKCDVTKSTQKCTVQSVQCQVSQ